MPRTGTEFPAADRGLAIIRFIPRPAAFAVACLLGAVAVVSMAGCGTYDDVTAWLTGAPTATEVAANQAAIDAANREREVGLAAAEAARKRVETAEEIVASAEQKQADLYREVADLAARAAEADTAAERDSLRDAMSVVEAQLLTLDSALGRAEDVAVAAVDAAAATEQVIADIDARLSRLDAQRAGFAQRDAEAGDNTAAAIESTAAVAGLIWPGAGALVTGIGGLIFGNRLRKGKTDKAQKTADDAIAILRTTEQFGLIRNDDAAKPAKAAARDKLTDDQARLLREETKHIRKTTPEERQPTAA